jgi:signal transduction histidine kinase
VVSTLPVKDYNGGLVRIYGAATDIHARKQSEEEQRETELRYRAQLEKEVRERTADLKASRDELQSMFDTTLIQMSILEGVRSEDGELLDLTIRAANKELEKETGRTDLVGKLYGAEYPRIREVGIFELIKTAISTGLPQQMEYDYSHEGVQKWYTCSFIKLGDGVVATNLDITERKMAEELRLKNLLLLEQSERVAKIGTWDHDLLTGLYTWSDGMYRQFEIAPGTEMRPEVYIELATPETRSAAERIVDHILTGDQEFEETLEIEVNGLIKVLRIKATVVRDEQGQPIRVLGVDLNFTAVRDAERHLRQLEGRQQQEIFQVILRTQEEERRRISESLHNGVGQLLYGTRISMNYLTVKSAVETPSSFDKDKAYTASLLTDSIQEIRRISHELMPTVLAEFGLRAAINEVCDQLQDGVRFNCQVNLGAVKFEDYVELAVFRTVQELMVNVVKHAKATRAEVHLHVVNDILTIEVKDNGQGMPPNQLQKPGIGLASIRNKVELIKGSLNIQSAPAMGTTITITLPLKLN